MHYHSAQHGQLRLHRAARFQHGETQLPSSTSLPEQPAPLPGASSPAAAVGRFERMQAELKPLQQQALATQQSLAQLQTRKPADPFTAIVSELQGVPAVDGALLGGATALVLTGAAVWWFVRHRARNRWIDAGDTRMQDAVPVSTQTPLQQAPPPREDTNDCSPSTTPSELSAAIFESANANARLERDIAFDSEAAATDVTRVRKSLAEKRETRARFLEREDATEPTLDRDIEPALDPGLELDLNLDALPTPSPAQARLESSVTSAAAREMESEAEPAPDVDPWLQPGEPLTGVANGPAGEAIDFSIALEDYGVKPDTPTTPDAHTPYEFVIDPLHESEPATVEELPLEQQPEATPDFDEPAAGAEDFDFTITMALAQESAALGLWTEARDLAVEVLASDNAALVAQAHELLARLKQMEQDAPPDTNWSTVR